MRVSVTEQLELPGGVAPQRSIVSVRLVNATPQGPGYTADRSVLSHRSANVGADGRWTMADLAPNVGTSSDVITVPPLTAYEVKVTAGQRVIADWRRFVLVESGDDPVVTVELADVLLPDPVTFILDGGEPATEPAVQLDGGTP